MEIIEDYIKSLLKSTPDRPLWNQEMLIGKKKSSWNYIDGCMMTAFLELAKHREGTDYEKFVKSFIDYHLDSNGYITGYSETDYNLDNINEGRVLFHLYDVYGDKKYRKAIEQLHEQIIRQPRTSEGNFWHKNIYPHQVWLDGLYMVQPFYIEYENRYNNRENYEDILRQFKNVRSIMREPETGLYYHAYDSSRKMFWADKKSGLSKNIWLRAQGWLYMALVDCIGLADESEKKFKKELSEYFLELTESLLNFQHESGMWYQLPVYKDIDCNYLETSGSAIISYAILKAVYLGLLPEKYIEYGRRAFNGICEKYLIKRKDKMELGGTCLVAGLGGKEMRDGSIEYYLSEPIVKNEAKGIAPFLLSYIYLDMVGNVYGIK